MRVRKACKIEDYLDTNGELHLTLALMKYEMRQLLFDVCFLKT